MSEIKSIDGYDILEEIGEGSFGIIYKAHDRENDRDVAIKLCSVDDEGLRDRFRREAETSAKLDHPHIVKVLAVGSADGVPYLVQELVPGTDLGDVIHKRAPLPALSKIDQLLQVASALAHAHSQNIIHRDIKPENIRLVGDGEGVKVVDFGIAKLASSETQLTQKGVTMGTASYLPPEQVRGTEIDQRADIFSFGVLAYELLAYERPFRGNTLSALVYQILYKVPLPITGVWTDCPTELSDLIGKCLEKKPERRFESFDALIPELQAVRDGIAEGRWPALTVETAPPVTTVEPAPADDDPLSQSMISRTVEDLEQAHAGDFTIATPEASSVSAFDGDSTRPVGSAPQPPAAAPALAEVEPAPPAATAVAVAAGASAAEPAAAELATQATQIGDLIAQGQLEAAMEQLEETMSRQRIATGERPMPATPPPPAPPPPLANPVPAPAATPPPQAPAVPPVAAAPAPPANVAPAAAPAPEAIPLAAPPAPADDRLGELRSQVAQQQVRQSDDLPEWAKQAKPVEATQPLSTGSTSPLEGLPDLRQLSQPGAAPPAPGLAGAATAPAAAPPPAKKKGGAGKWLAALALLAIVAGGGWWLTRDRAPEPAPPPPQVREEPRPTVAPPAPPVAPDVGVVLVHYLPWAEVTEIVDAQGFVQDLPANRFTPLYLELPAGSYQISLENPDYTETATCDVEVVVGTIEHCASSFTEIDVTRYFKDTGWWQ